MGSQEPVGYITRLIDTTNPTYSFAWVIDHSDFCCINVSYISQEFTTGHYEEDVWHLKFATQNHSNPSITPCCSLNLYLQSSKNPGSKRRVTFSYLGRDGYTHYEKQTEITLSTGSNTVYELLSFTEFFPVSLLSSINHAKLTICCKMMNTSVMPKLVPVPALIHRKTSGMESLKHGIIDDFESILKNGRLSDATLNVNGQVFHVHRAVLASRSPVFMATFENDMQEKQSNEVNIPDVDSEVMQSLLEYIYTDRVQNIEKSAKDLLIAAEKYQIEGLKSLCSRVLAENLNDENAIETLILSDLHNVQDLKIQTYNFIAGSVINIRELKGYDSLKVSRQNQNLVEALSAFECMRIVH